MKKVLQKLLVGVICFAGIYAILLLREGNREPDAQHEVVTQEQQMRSWDKVGGGPSFGDEVGLHFSSEKELVLFERHFGFSPWGKFNRSFPALVTSVETARDAISFEVGKEKHAYTGYEGYELKVVKMRSEKGESAYVFISDDHPACKSMQVDY